MAFSQVEARIGSSAIGAIDPGVPNPQAISNGNTNVLPSGAAQLGAIVRAVDPVLGEGEFIMLKGVAATVVGSVVVWDANFATTLAPATGNTARPIAFAMTANVNPANFAWYQITGNVTAFKDTAATIAANSPVGVSATGAVGASAAGLEIEGARSTNAAPLGAGTTSVPLYVERPIMQGRIT